MDAYSRKQKFLSRRLLYQLRDGYAHSLNWLSTKVGKHIEPKVSIQRYRSQKRLSGAHRIPEDKMDFAEVYGRRVTVKRTIAGLVKTGHVSETIKNHFVIAPKGVEVLISESPRQLDLPDDTPPIVSEIFSRIQNAMDELADGNRGRRGLELSLSILHRVARE